MNTIQVEGMSILLDSNPNRFEVSVPGATNFTLTKLQVRVLRTAIDEFLERVESE